MMSLHVLSAGTGYLYYTQETASGDQLRASDRQLGDYYTTEGLPPGQWVGRGAAALGVSGNVTEAQMANLFGQGRHPEYERILAEKRASGLSEKQARRKTEELAAKRREREATLQSLATDYHASVMMADAMVEEAERQAAELIAKAKKDAVSAGDDAKATVRKMLDTGETRQGIAELLDVSVSYVRGIDVSTAKQSKKEDTGADSSEESGSVGVLAGHEGSDH